MSKSISQSQLEKTVKILNNGEAVVSSLDISKIFNRTHKYVLSKIRAEIVNLEAININPQKYFMESSYIDSRGKTVPRYNLTRKGFDLISFGFTGKEAKMYQIWYIDEFHNKQKTIDSNKLLAAAHKVDGYLQTIRDEGKEVHTILTDTIKEYIVKYREEVEHKVNDGRYYYHYAKLIADALGHELPTGVKNNRDVLDVRQLIRLEDMERLVAKRIKEEALAGTHYKEAYKKIKAEILDNR